MTKVNVKDKQAFSSISFYSKVTSVDFRTYNYSLDLCTQRKSNQAVFFSFLSIKT